MSTIFGLLLLFQLKHFLADYICQGEYMLQKFNKVGWVRPLASHAAVHASFTWLIFGLVFGYKYFLYLSILDFVIHFTMDAIKARPSLMGRWKALTATTYATATPEQKKGNKYFWWALGFDQSVHHLTHYLLIWLFLTFK